MKKYTKYIFISIFFLISAAILALSLRGIKENPSATELSSQKWTINGPFELSPERGRFALTYSMVEDKSFFFSVPLARFALPDLGYANNHYVSLFAPAISYIIIPGYLIGKYFGASQVGAFATISLFALFNMILIQAIARKLKASWWASILASLVFLFATPAYAYAVDLYQHHVSTFLILSSIYILLSTSGLIPLFFVWFLCAMSIPVDYPNVFLMFPIGLYASARFFSVKTDQKGRRIGFKVGSIVTLLGIVAPLLFFLWFNKAAYNNPLQFSGTVPGVSEIGKNGKPTAPQSANKNDLEKYFNPELQQKSAVSFFRARNLITGLDEHLFAPDRGILYFTPVILFGIVGLVVLFRNGNPLGQVLLGIVVSDLLLYSLWGDPRGGWAFGSRYMIPGYAVLAIALAISLDFMKKYRWPLVLFLIALFYSLYVNTAGAITSSANPPQLEVLALEKISGHVQKYTFQRNIDELVNNVSKSFVYTTWLKKRITAIEYFRILVGLLGTTSTLLTIGLIVSKRKEAKK